MLTSRIGNITNGRANKNNRLTNKLRRIMFDFLYSNFPLYSPAEFNWLMMILKRTVSLPAEEQ